MCLYCNNDGRKERRKEKKEQKLKISSDNSPPTPGHISCNPKEFAKLSLGNTI